MTETRRNAASAPPSLEAPEAGPVLAITACQRLSRIVMRTRYKHQGNQRGGNFSGAGFSLAPRCMAIARTTRPDPRSTKPTAVWAAMKLT